MKKKIGFLGGSFDPIHFGHIHLGISLQETHELDQVIVCPAFRSPLKQEIRNAQHRLAMAKLATHDIPTWSVVDWEVSRACFSYTIETIRHCLKNIFKEDVQMFLLGGEDLLPELSRWKDVKELLDLAPALIGCRQHADKRGEFPFPYEFSIGLTRINVLEISATEIRQRLRKKLYCGHLVPAKVLDYITLHCIYSDDLKSGKI